MKKAVFPHVLIMSAMIVACATVGMKFDETKIQQIEKGKTTQEEILQLFGAPNNKGIGANGTANWTYTYGAGSVMGSSSSKLLMIMFNKDGVVENYIYQESKL